MGEWFGRTVVVTGGGRGFGKAIGSALATEGAHAVLVDIDGAVAEQAAAEIRSAGGSALGLGGDVTDEARMAGVMEQAAAERGGIDLLVNNAGLHSDEYGKPITMMGYAKVKRLFDVNVLGVVNCTLAAWPHMKGREGASIVNISSSAAHMGGSAYGDSKLAVGGLTITFARELGPDGIRVNAVIPAEVMTPLYEKWLQTFDDPDARLAEITRRIPLGRRMTKAEEIADTARLLAPEDEGDLKRSIEVTGPGGLTPRYSTPGGVKRIAENAAAVTVGNQDVRYGHLVEYGTSKTEAQPYFWPALRVSRKRAANRVKRAMSKAVRESLA